jgi:hypothetical protein
MRLGTFVRLTMQLRESFWTSERFMRRTHSQNLDRLAFVHSPKENFPVWWTSYPAAAPVLVAWSGGPRATDLAEVGSRTDANAVFRRRGERFRGDDGNRSRRVATERRAAKQMLRVL